MTRRYSKVRPYHPLDLRIRRALKSGMEDGIFVTIEYVYGFELFGAYENWRGGWKVTGRDQSYTHEYLEDAIEGWAKKVDEAWKRKRQAVQSTKEK